jgi:hypothetical protein
MLIPSTFIKFTDSFENSIISQATVIEIERLSNAITLNGGLEKRKENCKRLY